MTTAVLDVCANGNRIAVLDELTDEEWIDPDFHGPLTQADTVARSMGLESIICWGDASVMPATYTDAEWKVVVDARQLLGRPLDAEEVVALLAGRGVENAHG